MTRSHLMLSDTAMVLLRRRLEIDSDHADERARLVQGFMTSYRNLNRDTEPDYISLTQEIHWELLNDLCHLWLWPDVPVMRHYDWHLVLDGDGLRLLHLSCRLRSRWFQRLDRQPNLMQLSYGGDLIASLVRIYRTACDMRAQICMKEGSMSTSQSSLMLNDQAMVLLRQYVQLEEEEYSRLTHLDDESGHGFGDRVYESMLSGRFARTVIDELVQEIQILWLNPDLVPERHLDWHFVLNEEFMRQCRILFNPSRGYQAEALSNRAPLFVSQLAKAYKQAAAERGML